MIAVPADCSCPISTRTEASPWNSSIATSREREVVALIAGGLANRQIAEALTISERTAERHVANLLTKLDLTSRGQIAVWAVRAGLV